MGVKALILAAALALVSAAATAGAAPPKVVAVLPAPTTFIGRVDAALAASRIEEAGALIAGADASEPATRVALAKAEYALASNSLDDAAAGFTALLGEPAEAARAQQGLGLARLRQGKLAAAIAALDAAVAADPTLTRAWIARGVAADRVKDWPRADVAYAKAVELQPDSAIALTNRGYSRLLRGRAAEAVADLQKAVAIDPKLEPARTDLEIARAMTGDYKGAFAGSTKATLAHDLNTIGFAAMARGEYEVAEAYFTRAMQLNPAFDHTAWDNLVYLKQLVHASPGASVSAAR